VKAARVAVLATLTACGGGVSAVRPAPPASSAPASGERSVDAGTDAAPLGDEVPSLDALAARGPAELPLMREVLRSADATKPSILAPSSADVCFRAVVAASTPIRAWFEDETHAARGGELSGAMGLVPPRGPACARRGEKLRLVVEPASMSLTARAVVFQAP
jgi:hypothetical protein